MEADDDCAPGLVTLHFSGGLLDPAGAGAEDVVVAAAVVDGAADAVVVGAADADAEGAADADAEGAADADVVGGADPVGLVVGAVPEGVPFGTQRAPP